MSENDERAAAVRGQNVREGAGGGLAEETPMTDPAPHRAQAFRRLHAPGQLLLLPNAWDAASARLTEAAGALAVATTSAGVAWAHGYRDGHAAVPPASLAAAVAEIVRVLSVPLTVDVEGGYSALPHAVGETVAAVARAGAVGINIEDGADPPELLCEKIAAVREAADDALFVNVRTDVYLKRLAAPENAVHETLRRAERYQAAGADGLFVPGLRDAAAIRAIASGTPLPLNLMVVPELPPPDALRELGVRRVSAGSSIAQAAYGLARRAAEQMLEGRYDLLLEPSMGYGEVNGLFA
jgi:2-methylisocitrate lyase-like PEP mutase family enzyme